jgi:hypothetical protein
MDSDDGTLKSSSLLIANQSELFVRDRGGCDVAVHVIKTNRIHFRLVFLRESESKVCPSPTAEAKNQASDRS